MHPITHSSPSGTLTYHSTISLEYLPSSTDLNISNRPDLSAALDIFPLDPSTSSPPAKDYEEKGDAASAHEVDTFKVVVGGKEKAKGKLYYRYFIIYMNDKCCVFT